MVEASYLSKIKSKAGGFKQQKITNLVLNRLISSKSSIVTQSRCSEDNPNRKWNVVQDNWDEFMSLVMAKSEAEREEMCERYDEFDEDLADSLFREEDMFFA